VHEQGFREADVEGEVVVIDEIDKVCLYYGLGPGIEAALRYLASTELLKIEPGRYDLGGECFALVQDYETAPRGDICDSVSARCAYAWSGSG
jgi:hypothetical protein